METLRLAKYSTFLDGADGGSRRASCQTQTLDQRKWHRSWQQISANEWLNRCSPAAPPFPFFFFQFWLTFLFGCRHHFSAQLLALWIQCHLCDLKVESFNFCNYWPSSFSRKWKNGYYEKIYVHTSAAYLEPGAYPSYYTMGQKSI